MKKKLKIEKEYIQKIAKDVSEKTQDAVEFAVEKSKEGGIVVRDKYDIAKREYDKKRLRPIFADEIEQIISNTPYLIRIVDHDKKRYENDVCIDSIGFYEKIKGQFVLHIYSQYANDLGIDFFPCVQETLYCPNPYKSDMYICLDEYFDYIKKAKVDELETIAHKLGAKYVKISFKERKTCLVSRTAEAEIDAGLGKKLKKPKVKANAELDYSQNIDAFSNISVAAEVEFKGVETPSAPNVLYFRNESDIDVLIKMRMEGVNEIKSKTYTFESSSKHEMSEELASKIDAVIAGLKCAGNGTVTGIVQSEKRTVLEYKIEF